MSGEKAVYKKLSSNEHVRMRSGMYLGSKQPQEYDTIIISDEGIEFRPMTYSYALYKSIDEVIVNAIDHFTRTVNCKKNDKCTEIKVEFNIKTGEISVYNNGYGIEISKYEETEIYIPELIFSHVMSGSNFNDEDENKSNTGGMNGYGVKLCNITSKYFCVETVYKNQRYRQRFSNGNNVIDKPIIEKFKHNDYTKITFMPDYNWFYEKDYNLDIGEVFYELIETRTILVSVFCKTVKVEFNNEPIQYNSINQIMELTGLEFVKMTINDGNLPLDVCVSIGETKMKNLSLVNGIVVKSGVHFKFIEKEILKTLEVKINKTVKNTKISTKMITNHMTIMISGYVNKPDFSGQTKDKLTINEKYFKDYSITTTNINKIWTLLKPIIESVYVNSENKKLSKTDGKKKSTVLLDNLDDALWAGTKKSTQCRLILTEGLSASTYAISGLKKLGREKYGVFPLKGKMLNVRKASPTQINKNVEITNIKTILGLKNNHKYESLDELRYGGIIALTDADYDGIHIRALIINMIHAYWPELLKLGFITSIMTPIIKVIKGKEETNFYTNNEYEDWKESTPNHKSYTIKYYKGLGTSEKKDALAVFSSLDEHLIYYKQDVNTDYSINLGFNESKSHIQLRKEWLGNYDPNNYIKAKQTEITFTDMINKELIHFSNYDNIRSIPSVIDGLKPSLRKVIYVALKTMKIANVKGYKVSQFGNKVAELSDYHHGEVSLSKTIVDMAQNYIGSNNCNLLLPIGAFGCLSSETNVILFDGFTKKAKDINKNDLLMGDDAKERRVLKLVNGNNHMFRLFVQNYSYNYECFDCTIDHILTLHMPSHKSIVTRNNNKYIEWFDGENYCLSNNFEIYNLINDCNIFDVPLYKYIQWNNNIKLKFDIIKNNRKIELYKGLTIEQRELFINSYKYKDNSKIHVKSLYEDELEYINDIALSLGYKTIMVDTILIIDTEQQINNYKFFVTYLGLQKFYGWEVDCNNRFLIENFIVTHNSRIHNGKDAASPRYIFTNLTNTTPLLFNKYDNKLLNYIDSDGMMIEPDYYVPVLPVLLINGSSGIGTGYSTNIPPYDLEDIAKIILNKLKGKHDEYELIPSYRHYNGQVMRLNANKFLLIGTYEIVNANTIIITEIPIGVSINAYKSMLNDMIEKKTIKSYENNSNDSIPNFIIVVEDKLIPVLKTGNQTNILTTFNLTTTICTTNMHAFDKNGILTKYNSANEILDYFYDIRLEFYDKRKKYMIKLIEDELIILENKIRFIMMIVKKELKVIKVKISVLNEKLEELDFFKLDNKYDYLTSMPIHNLTLEKIEELVNKCKDITTQLNIIKAKSIKKMWMEDIVLIVKEYREYNKIIAQQLLN